MTGEAAELEAVVVSSYQTSVFHCVCQLIVVLECFFGELLRQKLSHGQLLLISK